MSWSNERRKTAGRVTLTSDNALILTVDEPRSWFDDTGLSFLSSSGVASPTEEFAPEAQVVLLVSLFPHSLPCRRSDSSKPTRRRNRTLDPANPNSAARP